MRITPEQVSFVFQGGIGVKDSPERKGVHLGLGSARLHFPGAELILSTWRGSVDEGFSGVTVVECQDPGPITCAGNEIINLNRQLVSSREGIAATTRPFVVKLRTDVGFFHGRLFEAFEKIGSALTLATRERILVLNLTSRNPRGQAPYPFMVCDWLYAGCREDLERLFALPNYPPEWVNWFTVDSKPRNDPYTTAMCRYYAETYIWYALVAQATSLDLEHSSDDRPHLVQASEEILAKNLILLNARQAGIVSYKHRIPFDYHHANYTHNDWLKLLSKWQVQHGFHRPLMDTEKWSAYYAGVVRPQFLHWYRLLIQRSLVRFRRLWKRPG